MNAKRGRYNLLDDIMPPKPGRNVRFALNAKVAAGIIEFDNKTIVAARVLYGERSNTRGNVGATNVIFEGGFSINTDLEYGVFLQALAIANSGGTGEYRDGTWVLSETNQVPVFKTPAALSPAVVVAGERRAAQEGSAN